MAIIASPYTRLFWNEYLLDPTRHDYNIVFDQTITGPLDIERLSRALTQLVSDHLLINSHLIEINEHLYWQTNESIEPLQVFEDTQSENDFVKQPFQLDEGPLYRFGLFKHPNQANTYDLIIVLHHALIDGTKHNAFIHLVSNYYKQYKLESNNNLQQQAQQIEQLNHQLEQNVEIVRQYHRSNPFWTQALADMPAQNELPYSKPGQSDSSEFDELDRSVEADLIDEALINELNTTQFTLLNSLWGVLIARYCNAHHASIAYPIALKQADQLIHGAQINTIILPISFDGQTSLQDLIAQSNAHIKGYKIVDHYRYSHLPTSDIITQSPINKLNVTIARTSFKNTPFKLGDCQTSINNRYININADISLTYDPNDDDLIHFKIKYKSHLFSKQFIDNLFQHYKQLLTNAIYYPDTPLCQLSLLTPEQYQQIIYDWNQTDTPYPQDKTIHQLFEEQVQQTPDNIAVIFDNQQLTYSELNQQANQLAYYIQKQYQYNLQPDTLIALCLDRSLDMIIAILGVLKAGAAYVPIDPEFPKERIRNILEDAHCDMILTQGHYETDLQTVTHACALVAHIICLDNKPYSDQSRDNLSLINQPNDLAYVIYTSGTTGQPKGVIVDHQRFVQFLNNFVEHLTSKTNLTTYHVLSLTEYVFDVFSLDYALALMYGGQITISSLNQLKPEQLKHSTIIQQTPTTLLEVCRKQPERYLQDMVCLVGGEPLPPSYATVLLSHFNQVMNIYGLTETVVWSTGYLLNEQDTTVSIGQPLANEYAYVLDPHLQPLPIGVVGELYIGGAGVSRGYLNQPELTKQCFITNPFATQSDIEKGRNQLYKTGDLVRWLPDGNIEYIGRNDFQVNIRGFRIELGDIESHIATYPAVQQACVIALDNDDNHQANDPYLVGYYVTESGEAIDDHQLIQHLQQFVPDYMMPKFFMHLKAFPLTVNGKLDRQALPSPEANTVKVNEYIPPQTELQTQICRIWETVLNMDKIGIEDDFFKMGGNSILAIRLSLYLSNSLNTKVNVADIFQYPTVNKLANYISYQISSKSRFIQGEI